jgi:transcriptional regulator with XRE-family HTH domain
VDYNGVGGLNMEIFIQRLKALCKDKDKKQFEIAQGLKMSPKSFSFLINSEQKPSFDTIIRMCKYFEVTADYLLGLSNYRVPEEKASKTVKLDALKAHLENCAALDSSIIPTLNRLLGITMQNQRKVRDDLDVTFLQNIASILNAYSILIDRVAPFSENLRIYHDKSEATVALYKTADSIRQAILDYGEELINAYDSYLQHENEGETNGDH